MERQQNTLMNMSAYLTLGTVGVGAILSMLGTPYSIWPVLVIFALLAGVMYFEQNNGPLWKQIVYLGALTTLTASLYFFHVDPGIFLILFFVISAQAMMLLPIRYGLAWIFILAIISALAFIGDQGLEGGLLVVFVYGGGYFFFGVFGYFLMEAQRERDRNAVLLEELGTTHRQLQDSMLRMEELAVSEERNRLAREMHDSLGHRLTVSAVQLEGAQRLIPTEPARAEEMVGTVREEVRQALAELRQTLATLRQPLETGLSIQQAITRLVEAFEQATKLTVNTFLEEGLPVLPDAYRLTLYRTAQEALTNVQRHAEAETIWLRLTIVDERISMEVSDDGKGIKADAIQQAEGFGFVGIRERVNQLAGQFFVDQRNGGGTQITIWLPLPGGQHD